MIKLGIVDDNVQITNFLKDYFANFPHIEVVGVAYNGKDGLHLAETQEMDILLLDIVMPYIDGLTLLQTIQDKQLPLHVIFLSAMGNEAVTQRAYELGAKHFFLKPFDPEQLVNTINTVAGDSTITTTINSNTDQTASANEKLISELLKSVGVPAHLKGYLYLKEALQMALTEEELTGKITRYYYPAIAKKFSTTASKVERSIRNAIEVAWHRGDHEIIKRIFVTNQDRPSNTEFIATLLEQLLYENVN